MAAATTAHATAPNPITATAFGAVCYGMTGQIITVTATRQDQRLITGLREAAERENRMRVRSALIETTGERHGGGLSVDVPSHIYSTCCLDLPLAVAKFAGAMGIEVPKGVLFLGELGFEGEIRPVNGTVAMLRAAVAAGIGFAVVPRSSRKVAALVAGIQVSPVNCLQDVVSWLVGDCAMPGTAGQGEAGLTPTKIHLAWSDIRKGTTARAAIPAFTEAIRAGKNVLLVGYPTLSRADLHAGQTQPPEVLLANRTTLEMTDATPAELIETTVIYDVVGLSRNEPQTHRPYRRPHHTISYGGMVGIKGGSLSGKPGEAVLAHNGVLFLDDLPHFSREVLIATAAIVCDGQVTTEVGGAPAVTFPAKVRVVAYMTPCPLSCKSKEACRCTPDQIARYEKRVKHFVDSVIDTTIYL